MSILTNKMSNLTENAKVLILSKLEEGWWIRRVAHYYNIAKSTVQRIKQTLLWVCHNSVNVSGNVIMLVEMAMVMLVVQCSQ
jgi:hypothetical protein